MIHCITLIALSIVLHEPTTSAKPTSHTNRSIEGWTVRIDDRLLTPMNMNGTRALSFLENKLHDITVVLPADKVKKLQTVTIVLDQSHGNLRSMQYHPSAGWLKANSYSTDLAKCMHLPYAADLWTKRNVNEQPWVILHELAHAYHDQILGFDEPRVVEAYENYKKTGRGEKTLLFNVGVTQLMGFVHYFRRKVSYLDLLNRPRSAIISVQNPSTA